ncbi:DNA polymerase [Staphylococcus phage S-CoN_Ph17]|nr:DNA polymerase [Staphylococcus phage S-CoN_Ph17]
MYDLTPIITTDAHYINKEQAFAHKIYLNALRRYKRYDSLTIQHTL